MKPFFYLATPFSKNPLGIDAAYRMACIARGYLVRAGIPCFSPIVHSYPVAFVCNIDPSSHDIWLPAERPILEAAFGLIVYGAEGWDQSYGIGEEIKAFVKDNKPIRFMPEGRPTEEFLAGLRVMIP
jgi:hypothetical protein